LFDNPDFAEIVFVIIIKKFKLITLE
jgi:hypothetical protein